MHFLLALNEKHVILNCMRNHRLECLFGRHCYTRQYVQRHDAQVLTTGVACKYCKYKLEDDNSIYSADLSKRSLLWCYTSPELDLRPRFLKQLSWIFRGIIIWDM